MHMFVMSNVPGSRRRRRGLSFEWNNWRQVDVLGDETDAGIEERQARGEAVVNESGLQDILADPGLRVAATLPPPPPPQPAAVRRFSTQAPEWMLELARDLDIGALTTKAAAEPAIIAALKQRAEAAPDPISRLFRRLAHLVVLAPKSEEARELRHAISDLVPFESGDPGAFGKLEPLPPIERAFWATNERAPQWYVEVANLIGASFPPPFAEPYEARERIMSEHANQYTDAYYSNTSVGTLASPLRAREVRGQVVHDIDRAKQAANVARDAALATLDEDSIKRAAEYSNAMDEVRVRVLAALDAAEPKAKEAVVRFGLRELGRHGRGLPASRALSADDAFALVRGKVAIEPVEYRIPDAATVELVIRARPPLRRHRRAGLEFTNTPTKVVVDRSTAKVLLANAGEHQGLMVLKVSGPLDASPTASGDLAGFENLTTDEIAAELERRKALAVAPSEKRERASVVGAPERIRSRRKETSTTKDKE